MNWDFNLCTAILIRNDFNCLHISLCVFRFVLFFFRFYNWIWWHSCLSIESHAIVRGAPMTHIVFLRTIRMLLQVYSFYLILLANIWTDMIFAAFLSIYIHCFWYFLCVFTERTAQSLPFWLIQKQKDALINRNWNMAS